MTQEPSILLVTIPDLPYYNNLNCKENNKFTDCSIRVVTLLTDIHLWLVQNLQFSPHDLVPYWTPDSFWQQDPYNINRSTSFSINCNTHMCHMHTHTYTHTHTHTHTHMYTTCVQSVESPSILLHELHQVLS